ncbi:MAG: hypothetical protein RJA98_3449 [Pseudomonadota bacterium]|jgi:diguanylate cyclase (GGDEF)-like protein
MSSWSVPPRRPFNGARGLDAASPKAAVDGFDGIDRRACAPVLAELNQAIVTARAQLLRLRREVREAQQALDDSAGALLLATNERLVIASLESRAEADSALTQLDEIARTSQHDALTGMPLRGLMLDRLDRAITLAQRRAAHVAVVFVDLDGFKHINDTQGHAVGDAVLQWVAAQLSAVVRESDTVSRHGGDEFVVLLAELMHRQDAMQIVEKMQLALAQPCWVGSQVLHLSASLGLALSPQDGVDAASLIGLADAAMYVAKRRGPGGVAWHQSALG